MGVAEGWAAPANPRWMWPTLFIVALAGVALRLGVYTLARGRYSANDLCQWDCAWYIHTAEAGYDTRPWYTETSQANWAFFPLYPLLIRAVSLAGAGLREAAFLVSGLCFALFIAVAARYRQATRRHADAVLWLGFMLLLPTGFWFVSGFTESLYALLVTLALMALRQRRAYQAALWLGLLAATRPTGVLLLPCLLACVAGQALARRRAGVPAGEVLADLALPPALAVLPLVAFMAYLRLHVGDGLAFVHAQQAWDRTLHDPLPDIASILFGWRWSDGWANILAGARLQLPMLAAWAATAWLLRQRLWAEAWLLFATWLLAQATGTDSLPRFVACAPPFLFAACDLLQGRRWPVLAALAALAIAASAVLMRAWYGHAGFLS